MNPPSPRYCFTKIAIHELLGLIDQIAAENPPAAGRLYDTILAKCRHLAEWPLAGQARPEYSRGLRSLAVEHHVIFYTVLSGGQGVRIRHVLDGRRGPRS